MLDRLSEEARVWKYRASRSWNAVRSGGSPFEAVPRVTMRSFDLPPPREAQADGLLAIGGDLSPERVLAAYRQGAFPWYVTGWPILWYSPDPRFVLDPAEVHVPHNVKRVVKKVALRLDTAFEEVLEACAAAPRRNGAKTWLTPALRECVLDLYAQGYAHSAEAWQDGKLVAGSYGIAIGRAFFGESMFTSISDGSKALTVLFAQHLRTLGFAFLDCQVHSAHLEQLGARNRPRQTFLEELSAAVAAHGHPGRWS